jgi:hypothetical protein
MTKKCSKGKSCGATCINSGDGCRVDFKTTLSSGLDQAVDKILSHKQYLNTGEKAADWLESHKDQLAGSQLGSWGDSKGDLVVFAIEPSGNPKEDYYDNNKKMYSRLTKVKEEDSSDLASDSWGPWYDKHPLVFANDIRQRLQVHNAIKKAGGGEMALGHETAKRLKKNDEGISLGSYGREGFVNRKGAKPFVRKMSLMMQGSEWKSVMGMNMSPFALPSDKYWPFEKLPLPANSPLKSREKWLKYAAAKATDNIREVLAEHPRKVVMFGANGASHKRMFQEIAGNLGGKTSTKTVEWKSSAGRPMKAEVTLFSVETSNGRTVFVQTSHPSWTGWTNEALGEVSKLVQSEQAK